MTDHLCANSVLFVCFGNVCRSPMAEAIFRQAIQERQLEDRWIVDSCSLSNYFRGDLLDKRALKVLRKHDLDSVHTSRQLVNEDFDRFDYIFGFDEYIVNELNERKNRLHHQTKATIKMIGDYYDPSRAQRIGDPYFSDLNDLTGYEHCYEVCVKSINSFLDRAMCANK